MILLTMVCAGIATVRGTYDYRTHGEKHRGRVGSAKPVSPENQCIESIPLSDDVNCEYVAQRTESCKGNFMGNPIEEIILDGGGCDSLYQVKRGYRREFHVKKLSKFDWQCGTSEKVVDFTKAVNKVYVNYKSNGEVQFIGHACNKKGENNFLEASDTIDPEADWQGAWEKLTAFRQDQCTWTTVENMRMKKDPVDTLKGIFKNQCKAACCSRKWCDASVFKKVEQTDKSDDDDNSGRAWSGECYLYTDVGFEQLSTSHLTECSMCDLFYIGADRDQSAQDAAEKLATVLQSLDQGIKDSCSINYISALNEAHGRSPTFCKKESLPVGKAYVPAVQNWFDGHKCFGSHPEYRGGLCYQKCPRTCSTVYNRYIATEKVQDPEKGFLAPSCFTKCSDMGLVECGVSGTALYCGKDALSCTLGVANIVVESLNVALSIGTLLMAGPAASKITKIPRQGFKKFTLKQLRQKQTDMKKGLWEKAKKLGKDAKDSFKEAVDDYKEFQEWKKTASRTDLLRVKAKSMMELSFKRAAWGLAGGVALETANAIQEVCGEVANGILTGEKIDVAGGAASNDDDDAPWFDTSIFSDPSTYDPTGILDLMEAIDQPTCGQYGEEDDYNDTFQCLEDPVEVKCKSNCGWCVHVDTVRSTCKGNLIGGGNDGITIRDMGYLFDHPIKMKKGEEVVYSYYYDNYRKFNYDCGDDMKEVSVSWTGGLLSKLKPGDPQFNVVKATYKNDGAFDAQLYWCKSESEACLADHTHCDTGSPFMDVMGTPHCARCCGRSHYRSMGRDWCKPESDNCFNAGHHCTTFFTWRTKDNCDGCCGSYEWNWGIWGHKCT